MVRAQIQFTEEQHRELHRIAAERGVSVASLVRDAVDELLRGSERELRWQRAWAVVGRFADPSGATDVAREHDRYLDDAYSH